MSQPPTIRFLRGEERDRAELIWRGLEARVPGRPLAASWGWTSIWLRHYGDVVPHRFAIGEVDGAPCGITLLCEDVRNRGPIRLRRVHLGTAAEPRREGVFVERNGVLVDPGRREQFAASLIGALRAERGWSELWLDGFCPEHAEPFLRSDSRFRPRRAASPRLELEGASGEVESVLALIGSRTRKRLRRYLRALGPIRAEWAEGPDHAVEIFDELCAHHQGRWVARGYPGAFARSRFRSFHRDLISQLNESVILFRVRAGDETVACLYNLIDRGDALSYQAGIRSNGDNRVSPGLVAHVLCMAACAERRLHRYDFLAGEAQYKRQLTNGQGELIWARAQRPLARILKPGRGYGPS
jgi:hypothetical protein